MVSLAATRLSTMTTEEKIGQLFVAPNALRLPADSSIPR